VHSKYTLQCVEKCCRDLRGCSKLFGGLTFLGSGDWRQTLPIADRVKTSEDSVGLCLINWDNWEKLEFLHLRGNMRLLKANAQLSATDERRNTCLAEYLMKIGDGVAGVPSPTAPGADARHVELDEGFHKESLLDLQTATYANVTAALAELEEDGDKAKLERSLCSAYQATSMLTLKIQEADDVNRTLQSSFTQRLEGTLGAGAARSQRFAATDVSCNMTYRNGLVKTLGGQISGLPPFELELGLYSPVLLLRNVDVERGLTNGTRGIVMDLTDDAILMRILSGKPGDVYYMRDEWICRRKLVRYKNGFKIEMTQFPLVLAWALTVHKAQGQSIERLGVYLKTCVFCHGQLYVALSRASCAMNVHVFVEHDPLVGHQTEARRTVNIVSTKLREVFLTE